MSTRGQPAVRASAARDSLAFLDTFQAGARDRVKALIPPESLTVIEETSRLSWIPIEHDHFIVDGIVAVLGRERGIRCWADSVATLTEQPLLKAFVGGALSLVGHDPARVLAWMPKGWSMVWRDMCTPRFALDASGQPVIHFDEVHPEVRRYESYFASWHGSVLGFARLTGVPVQVTFTVAPDKSHAQATFHFNVRPTSPPPR